MSFRRSCWPLCLFLSVAAAPTVSAQSPAPAASTVSVGSITAISGNEATINLGANAGLVVGQELRVVRDGHEAGRIVLASVGATTSTGRVFSYVNDTVQVLDSVSLVPPAPLANLRPYVGTSIKTILPDSLPAAPRKTKRPSYNEHAGDIIPWERWEYLALSSLAADGLIPGTAARDFQNGKEFTRGQLADFTRTALANFNTGKRPERDIVFLRRLAEDFQFEPPLRETLKDLGPAVNSAREEAGSDGLGYSAYGGLRYLSFKGDDRVQPIGRVGGIFDLNKSAYVALSLNNLHRLTSALPDRFKGPDVLTLNFHALDTDWELGRTYWSSGPVASGDGLLSDNAPGLYMLKGRKTFSWGKFPGKFVATQIYGGFQDTTQTKYYGLRRIETQLGGSNEFGLAESYISTKAPNPLSLVLPYYAYQRISVFHQGLGGHGGDATGNDSFNYMAQADILHHISRNVDGYFELIIDDISAPSGLGLGNVPRKLAYVIGGHIKSLWHGRGEVRAEIYDADRETYLGIAPQVEYSEKDLYLGSPFGSNTQAFYGRLDYKFTHKFSSYVQLRDALQGHNGLPDMGDRFELTLSGSYDFAPDRSVTVRWIPQRFRGINYVDRPTTVDVLATYAF